MIFYIIQTSTFVKIGITDNFDNRFKAYVKENVLCYDCYDLKKYPTEVGSFLEVSIMHKFKSETEYLYNVEYENVKKACDILLENIVYSFFFLNPLNINLICLNNIYYDFKPALEYVNKLRVSQGKNVFKMADYLKKIETKEFAEIVKKQKGLDEVIFGKCGRNGSTYGTPEMLFDFLISVDMDAKYDILNWSIKNKIEYKKFLLSKSIESI
jgi:hypothetical protein